jgi:aminodeoxyfutalosine synthase
LSRTRLEAAGLAEIADKVAARERLSFDDGVSLFTAPDLLSIGWLAHLERERRHGGRTYFNHNLRLEATNVCEASCLFCSFARLRPNDAGAHTMSVEQVLSKLRQRAHEPLTEIHIVNGLHPELPFDYYKDLLRGLKQIRPDIHLKCFTAVEIAFFADLYGLSDEQVLVELREAGLDSLPGGGAERASAARSVTTNVMATATSQFIARHTGSACAPTSRCSTGTSRRSRSASII